MTQPHIQFMGPTDITSNYMFPADYATTMNFLDSEDRILVSVTRMLRNLHGNRPRWYVSGSDIYNWKEHAWRVSRDPFEVVSQMFSSIRHPYIECHEPYESDLEPHCLLCAEHDNCDMHQPDWRIPRPR